jgi:hypothetical protein
MGYGARLSYRSQLEETNMPLLNSIGYLCGAILGRLLRTSTVFLIAVFAIRGNIKSKWILYVSFCRYFYHRALLPFFF